MHGWRHLPPRGICDVGGPKWTAGVAAIKTSQRFSFILQRGSSLLSADHPIIVPEGPQKHHGGWSCDVLVQPCTLRKSVEQATGTLLFWGCCKSASTHCQMSGRLGNTNAAFRGFGSLCLSHLVPWLQPLNQGKHLAFKRQVNTWLWLKENNTHRVQ